MESKALTSHFLLKIILTLFLSICIIFCFHFSVKADTRDWTFDNSSDYTVSNPAAIEVTGGVAQTTSGFDDIGWNYRRTLTIDNPNSQLDEYQIEVRLDSSHSNFWSHVASDGSDIRFTDSDGATFIDFYVYHFDYTLQEAGIWVKVPIISTPSHTIYLYYGNDLASDDSDIVATFSYSVPRTVGYVVSDRIATKGKLNIISLADGNKIKVGSKNYSLDEGEMEEVPNKKLKQDTPILATDLFHADGSEDGTDMISPVSWAATEFTYYSNRNTNDFHLLTPWDPPYDIANVTIYSGGNQEWSGTIDNKGTVVTDADIGNGKVVRITSDIPILVQHLSTGNQDSGVYYPASDDYLYGIASNYLEIGSGPDGAEVSLITSGGATDNQFLGFNMGYSLGGLGSQGDAPAYRVESTYPIGVNQLADSDGIEFTTFLPKKEMGTRFGANNKIQYLAIAAPDPDTECTFSKKGGTDVDTKMGGNRTDINKIYFGETSNGEWQDAGWECECDKPVYAYYEKSDTDDETNLMSYPQMRQFVYPTPAVSSVSGEESLFASGSPWVSPTSESAQSFTSISSFIETAQKNDGEIYYQLSNDSGSIWRYWNGTSWESAGPDDYNIATSIQENITSFPTGGQFLFKAFLVSDGSAQVILDNIQINYLISLQVTGINPSFGYNDTLTNVEVSGENFKDGAEVIVGGFGCEVLSVTTNTITATVPEGIAPGLYGVSVKNPDGEITNLLNAFLMIDPLNPPDDTLQVTGIDPSFGYNDTLTTVKVSGEKFKDGAEVSVGSFGCEVLSVTANTIVANVPEGIASGLYGVSVKNPDEEVATLPEAFLVIDPLNPPDNSFQVTGIDPSFGYNDKPTDIEVSGKNFEEGAEVFVGGFGCEVTSVNNDAITATVPKGIAPGLYDVSVKNPGGEVASLPDAFLMIDSSNQPDPDLPPLVESLYPSTITNEEDSSIVILGENFVEVPEVLIGETVLNEVDYMGFYTLKVTVPGNMPAGSYDITVINPNGKSHLLEDGLVIVEPAPPVIVYVLPDSTLDSVSVDVVIIGFNFEGDSTVTLGDTELTDVTYISSTTLMVTVPAGTTVGVYDIVVNNSDGRSGRLENGFTVISTQSPLPENVDLNVFPDFLLGSRWIPLLNIVLIQCEDRLTFTFSSLVSFDSDDINILSQGVWDDHTLAVFLSSNPDPQEGVISITISDVILDGEIVTIVDPDALTISLLPLIFEEI